MFQDWFVLCDSLDNALNNINCIGRLAGDQKVEICLPKKNTPHCSTEIQQAAWQSGFKLIPSMLFECLDVNGNIVRFLIIHPKERAKSLGRLLCEQTMKYNIVLQDRIPDKRKLTCLQMMITANKQLHDVTLHDWANALHESGVGETTNHVISGLKKLMKDVVISPLTASDFIRKTTQEKRWIIHPKQIDGRLIRPNYIEGVIVDDGVCQHIMNLATSFDLKIVDGSGINYAVN